MTQTRCPARGTTPPARPGVGRRGRPALTLGAATEGTAHQTPARKARASRNAAVYRGRVVTSRERSVETAALDDEGYRADLDDGARAFQRLYGPWDAFDPREARELFDPLGIPWWVAGGWAIEAFTGVSREHEDIDVSMFRRDLPVLRSGVAGRYHVWAAGEGALSPLEAPEASIPDTADQVWLRAHALAPWRADVVLNPDDHGRWVSRRDRSYVVDLDDVTWQHDGICFLRPEVALAFKAKSCRPKDQADLDATLPLLDEGQRRWLADFLDRIHPGHAWRDRL